MIDSDLRVIESFEREIALLDDLLVKRAYGDPRVRLLVTLPGVGLHVAVALLAALGDVHRFRSGAHAASYLGLVPRTKQSAHHCYHGPITKAGNVHARATGNRRKPGLAKGQQPKPKLGPGRSSRTIKPLRQVYEREGLPPIRDLPPGVRAYLRRAAIDGFLEQIDREQVVPLNRSTK